MGNLTITTDIQNCARCGFDHAALTFAKLTRPIVIGDTYAYWATCPTNGEPVLLAVVDDGKE